MQIRLRRPVCEHVEAVDNRLDLFRIHIVREVIDPALDHVAQIGMLLPAEIRQVHAPHAAILLIALAHDEALLLQQVHRARHDGLIEVQHRGQVILLRALIIKDADQHHIFGIRQVELLTGLHDEQLRPAVQDRKPAADVYIIVIHRNHLSLKPITRNSPCHSCR